MVFSSYIFIFAFLPMVLLGFYLLPRLIAAPGRLRRAQNLLLIADSLVFYGYYSVKWTTIPSMITAASGATRSGCALSP